MKKNGFTLMEILAVVVILGMIMMVVAPNLINSIQNKKTDVTKAQKQMIEDAANLYADSVFNGDSPAYVCISFSKLKETGYINQETIDVSDTQDLNYMYIKITNTKPRTITTHYSSTCT